jgi:Rod binding domain-containing protein
MARRRGLGLAPAFAKQQTQRQATNRKPQARKAKNRQEHQTARPDFHGCFLPTPVIVRNKPQATSHKPQAKSKKGAHLSADPSPAWRDRDFVPLCGTPGR